MMGLDMVSERICRLWIWEDIFRNALARRWWLFSCGYIKAVN